uniref:Uncharacterized protein n=1 Tax=Grammatophora oceanica TaxID=210454 RepID=A0A7S1UTS4_9STRA|mmetsp:Transcript_22705/g.33674  ORF Transcript_22705/g.33674 Transcript_22705/m.33674 type:complete len:204 (+) Transcript_22705:295-906(+)
MVTFDNDDVLLGSEKRKSSGLRRGRQLFVRSNHHHSSPSSSVRSRSSSGGGDPFVQQSISDQASCSFLGEESLADSLCYSTATESMMSGYSSTMTGDDIMDDFKNPQFTLVTPDSQFRKHCSSTDDGSVASSVASPSMNSISSATSLTGRPKGVQRTMSGTSVTSVPNSTPSGGGGAGSSRRRGHRRQNFVFLGGNELTFIDR